jgi:hypothetical protein
MEDDKNYCYKCGENGKECQSEFSKDELAFYEDLSRSWSEDIAHRGVAFFAGHNSRNEEVESMNKLCDDAANKYGGLSEKYCNLVEQNIELKDSYISYRKAYCEAEKERIRLEKLTESMQTKIKTVKQLATGIESHMWEETISEILRQLEKE